MEKRISRKISNFVVEFKKNIVQEVTKLGNTENTNKLCQFIYNYEGLSITKEDLQKRKRVKNIVPLCYRCTARRANKEQCTRRRKEDYTLCGTHIKGTPHGIIDNIEKTPNVTKVTVWAQDVSGIIYYLDDKNNVYNPQDIFENKENPRIIAKYERDRKSVV